MTKQEFLENLRVALNGKIATGLVTENMRFYEDYINTEIRKGKKEEDVLADLGDPRLIARTIVETKGGRNEWSGGYTESSAEQGDRWQERNAGRAHRNAFSKVPVWVWLIISILIVIVILSFVFSIISAVLPVLLPILVVLLLVKVFRDWMH